MLARKLIAAMAGQASGAAAYRYWRIFMQTNNGGNSFQLWEIELRSAIGGADLTSPSTPVLASSTYGSYAPAYLIDNATSGSYSWASNFLTTDQWVRFDLGTAVPLQQVAILTYSSAVSPKDFIVQGSNDGTTFSDVKSFTGVTGWTGAWKTFDL